VAKGDELLERFIDFGVAVLRFSSRVPRASIGRHLHDQLVRSATSAGSNYAEARGAESLRDFVHKLGVVRKELNEAYVWLRMLDKAGLGDEAMLSGMIKECDELCRIIAASRKTAEARLRSGTTLN
jgi:four helix bundle protein